MDPHEHPTAGNGALPPGIQDDDLDLRDLWNFTLRNRLLILGVFGLALITAAWVTSRATPVYRAGASIRIEDGDRLSPIASVLGSDVSSLSLRIETEMGVLRSRSLAEDVVDSLQLSLDLSYPRRVPRMQLIESIHVERWAVPETYELLRLGEGRFSIEAQRAAWVDTVAIGEPVVLQGGAFTLTPLADRQDRMTIAVRSFAQSVAQVRSRLIVTRPDRLAAIVIVDYESPDSVLVDDVPNLVTRRYIQMRLNDHQAVALGTVRFLQGQLDSLSLELTRAEDELQAYREGQQVVSLAAEASAQVTQLARLQADRNGLDAERGALQQLLEAINRELVRNPVRRGEASPYRRLVAFPSLLRNQAASQILQSMSTIENERAVLLRRRTIEDPDVESLTSRIEELEVQLRSIALTYLEGLGNQVVSLDQTLERFGGELSRIPAKELAVARLERQSGVLQEIYMMLQMRLKEAEIARVAEDPGVRVLDPAVLNPAPVSPNLKLNLLLGGLLGLMLGVGVAAGKDFLDSSIHTREDIERASGGLPVLASIPQLTLVGGLNGYHSGNGRSPRTAFGQSDKSHFVTLDDPRDPVSEAYRTLRTSLRFSRMGDAPKTVVITSALPQDGKSTTAANLAIAFAQQGMKTLLIDADLRRGVLAKFFGLSSRPGLSNVLVGDVAIRDAFRRVEVSGSASLQLLPAGAFPPNPAELIGSDRMESLLRKLEVHFDAIVVDTPPLNLVTDAAILGAHGGGGNHGSTCCGDRPRRRAYGVRPAAGPPSQCAWRRAERCGRRARRALRQGVLLVS